MATKKGERGETSPKHVGGDREEDEIDARAEWN
jgi:hypothetical protein